jgi:hypothetical protein
VTKALFPLVFLFLLILGAATLMSVAPIAGEAISQGLEDAAPLLAEEEVYVLEGLDYGALPLTNHAIDGHEGERWNAVSIQGYFDTGKCVPDQYSCIEDDFEVHSCLMDNGKKIGLVIGRTVRQIITGFMASPGYWDSRCN